MTKFVPNECPTEGTASAGNVQDHHYIIARGLTLRTSTGSLSTKIERMYTKAGADEKIAVTSVEEMSVRPLR